MNQIVKHTSWSLSEQFQLNQRNTGRFKLILKYQAAPHYYMCITYTTAAHLNIRQEKSLRGGFPSSKAFILINLINLYENEHTIKYDLNLEFIIRLEY